MSHRPIIACSTYDYPVNINPPVDMNGLATSYRDAIIRAGGIPLLLPLNLDEAAIEQLLSVADGVLFPGGGDIDPANYTDSEKHSLVRGIDAKRDFAELYLARAVVDRNIPFLAICRGHQVVNVAQGGTLYQDVRSQRQDAITHDYYGDGISRQLLPHHVDIERGSQLADLLAGPISDVNSIHHQGVEKLGKRLSVVATAPDGLIEAFEVDDHRFGVSVQWHPEELIDSLPQMMSLFQGLVTAAAVPAYS